MGLGSGKQEVFLNKILNKLDDYPIFKNIPYFFPSLWNRQFIELLILEIKCERKRQCKTRHAPTIHHKYVRKPMNVNKITSPE